MDWYQETAAKKAETIAANAEPPEKRVEKSIPTILTTDHTPTRKDTP